MRIAQILNNKAHWIFEAEEIPNYPLDPDGNKIILIDITNNPEIQEGWDYDSETKLFTEPMLEEIEEITSEETVNFVTNEELKELQLLQIQIALENIEEKRGLNPSLNATIEGYATLILNNKLRIDKVPSVYMEEVENELKELKDNSNQ